MTGAFEVDSRPMSHFTGGSAYAMVQQVAEGYLLVTERTLRRLKPGELDRLGFEIGKMQRQIRATPPPPLEDTLAIQQRNRRLQRLSSCRTILDASRRRQRRV